MDWLGLAKLFVRFGELCVAVAALWWMYDRVPLAGEYLRRFSGVLGSPLFVFVLCHVIVVSLMADSGKFSARNRRSDSCENDDGGGLLRDPAVEPESRDGAGAGETGEVVFEDKQVISESNTAAVKTEEEDEDNADDSGGGDLRHYRRWRSENFERERHGNPGENLRRSESEKCLGVVVVFSGEEQTAPTENPHSHDKLSDEDFNRTVEAFIAKQLKFRRQEHSPELPPLLAPTKT